MLVEMLLNTFLTPLVFKNGVFVLFREVDIIVMSITKTFSNTLTILFILYWYYTIKEQWQKGAFRFIKWLVAG